MSQRVKIFTVLMVVLCAMSLTCVTAFAAAEDVWSDVVYVTEPGAQMTGYKDTAAHAAFLLPVQSGYTYTLTADWGRGVVKAYDPDTDSWTEIYSFISGLTTTYTADGQYTYLTVVGTHSSTPVVVTVTWEEPSQTETIMKSVPSIAESLLAVVVVMMSLVSSQALAMLPVYIGLIFVGILLAVSLIRNR